MAKIKISALVVLFILSIISVAGQSCVAEKARSQIGVFEATGNNDGSEVAQYLATTGLNEGYAWCAAFVNWTHEQCNLNGPPKAAWSPSWFPADRTIYICGQSEAAPVTPGTVFGIYFRSKQRIAHVGIIESFNTDASPSTNPGKFVTTIEGNTNKAGSRDGVYRKKRIKRQIYKVADWS